MGGQGSRAQAKAPRSQKAAQARGIPEVRKQGREACHSGRLDGVAAMSHCKQPHPEEPGFYWARHFATWIVVEVRGDGFTYAAGIQLPVMRTDDVYGNIEAWGPKVPPPGWLEKQAKSP